MAGSIGFHHVLRECGATEGDLNDLDTLPLGPLERGEARELAQRLLLGIDRPTAGEDTLTALVESSGGIPWLLHILASMLHDGSGLVTAQEVAATFDAFVADRDQSRGALHFLTRLDPNYGQDADLAKAILDFMADQPAPMSPPQIAEVLHHDRAQVARVVDHLLDDHYLSRHGDFVAWRYEVLRRMWTRLRCRGTAR
ncbi:MAG: hypothetical protein V9G19_01185 [Tetrasphaera sp.]